MLPAWQTQRGIGTNDGQARNSMPIDEEPPPGWASLDIEEIKARY